MHAARRQELSRTSSSSTRTSIRGISFYRGPRSGSNGATSVPIPSSGRDARDAAAAAEAVSRAPVRGHVLREPLASVPAVPDRALQRAPCVRLVSPEDYAQDVADTIRVLDGRNTEVIADLGRRMEAASQALKFEDAARLRDQISMLKHDPGRRRPSRGPRRRTSTRSPSRGKAANTASPWCTCAAAATSAAATIFQRAGSAARRRRCRRFSRSTTSRAAPPPRSSSICHWRIATCSNLRSANGAGMPVRIRRNVRGTRARWLAMARTNAELGLSMRASSRATVTEQLDALTRELQLGRPPARIECFDVSHTMGESAVASCVVFGVEGPIEERLPSFQPARAHTGRRLRWTSAGGRAALHTRPARRIANARSAADRRRSRAAQRGARGTRCARRAGTRGRGGRERRRSQGRTGAPILGRSGSAAYTCAGLAGVASDSAHSRRSASLRDLRASTVAGQHAAQVAARGDSGARSETPHAIC